jgi:putative DNA primase/helicase
MTDQPTISLDDEAITLVRRLGGQWQGDTAVCYCPVRDHHVPQLQVQIDAHGLLLRCFAGCKEDQIVAAIAHLLPEPATNGEVLGRQLEHCHPAIRNAHLLWDGGQPIKGTKAERYLSSLGIDVCASELRYTPHCCARSGQSVSHHPALLAAVRDRDGLVAVERSYLREDGLTLADIPNPKRMLGLPSGGLGRWGMVPTKILRLAETVEDAASAMIVGSQGIPVWPVFGHERYASIDVPDGIEQIIIYANAGEASAVSTAQAVRHLEFGGRAVECLFPPRSLSWNSYLRLIRS